MSSQHKVFHEVLLASFNWISAFNRGDVDTCVAGYHQQAVINAKPIGQFVGKEQIDDFWRPFINDGASDLVYYNVQLAMESDNTVLLSANWYMNVGRGIITQEKWVKQSTGIWQLEQDDFEIQEQYS